MALRTNSANLTPTIISGTVTRPELGGDPFLISADGRPFIPLGQGGVLYGYGPGSPAYVSTADHPEPGATIAAPPGEANQALLAFACLGNTAFADGDGARLRGRVVGLRGEGRGVFVDFAPRDLEEVFPGTRISVHCLGRGLCLLDFPDVALHHLSPHLVDAVVRLDGGRLAADVRAAVPSYLLGNGVGRPAATWEVDLQSGDGELLREHGLAALRIGDVVALRDWEAVTNQGYSPGAVTLGVVVHGDSPLPGHGPGILPVLCDPHGQILWRVDPDRPHLFQDRECGT